jgi:hypothetical protein
VPLGRGVWIRVGNPDGLTADLGEGAMAFVGATGNFTVDADGVERLPDG